MQEEMVYCFNSNSTKKPLDCSCLQSYTWIYASKGDWNLTGDGLVISNQKD